MGCSRARSQQCLPGGWRHQDITSARAEEPPEDQGEPHGPSLAAWVGARKNLCKPPCPCSRVEENSTCERRALQRGDTGRKTCRELSKTNCKLIFAGTCASKRLKDLGETSVPPSDEGLGALVTTCQGHYLHFTDKGNRGVEASPAFPQLKPGTWRCSSVFSTGRCPEFLQAG